VSVVILRIMVEVVEIGVDKFGLTIGAGADSLGHDPGCSPPVRTF
jgi:hypothetical protein